MIGISFYPSDDNPSLLFTLETWGEPPSEFELELNCRGRVARLTSRDQLGGVKSIGAVHGNAFSGAGTAPRVRLDHRHLPLPSTTLPTIPSQHSAKAWATKKAKQAYRMSAEVVLKPATAAAPSHPGAPGSAVQIPEIVENGTTMTKLSDKGKKRVEFRVDADEGRIVYKSKKNGPVPIEAIKELRSGKETRYYRSQFSYPEEAESRWITIIYILQGNYKTLHILADTAEQFEAWDATLRKLYAIRQGLTSGVGNTEVREAVWERQYWKGADEEGDQKLDFDDVERLCKRLHANLKTTDIRHLFEVGRLTFDSLVRSLQCLGSGQ